MGQAQTLVLWLAVCCGFCLPFPDLAAELRWDSGPGYRRARLTVPAGGHDGFTLMPSSETGIVFTNFLAEERMLTSQILPSGSGVAAGDVDGDGWCDLYFCGLRCGNRLYRNLGNWKFEDITERAGVACTNLDATGAALVDVDGDGALDLIVNSLGGGTHVFLNDGKGHFHETQVLNPGLGGMSLGLADYDGDGRLDLYVANYRVTTVSDRTDLRYNLRPIDGRLTIASINGRPLTDPEWTNRFEFHFREEAPGKVKFSHEELGEPDVFYRNVGGGRFELVSWTGGTFLDETGKPLVKPPFDWGLSVMFRDLNGDGHPDLYICNDFNTPDRMWLNDGHGHFRAAPALALRQMPLSSMAVDVADVNRDGYDDLFVGDMLSRDHRRRLVQRINLRPELLPLGAITNRPQYSRNMLQLNRGDGTYAEIAQFAGVEASEWSWTPIFLDVDLDGYEDLLIANGFPRDNMNLDALEATQRASQSQNPSETSNMQLRRLFPRLAPAKVAFRNLGNMRFVEAGHQWGFDTEVISQGMCLADLDHDGDLDVIANNLNSVASIYRNDSAKPRVAVTLKGHPPNTRGIGAKITLFGGPVPMQSQQIVSAGRYLSCDEAMRVFAAGSATNLLTIEVDWPDGRRSVVKDAQANCLYEIEQTGAQPRTEPPVEKAVRPFFQDVSSILNHTHHEEPYDDFARQPPLARRLSQLGPGVCWSDLNGDGLDDLVVGTGKGGTLSIFFNDGKGGFQPAASILNGPSAIRDQTTVVAWQHGTNNPALLVGSANYEDGASNGASVQEYQLATGQIIEAIAGDQVSVGPLALADVDGDGNLDLFVGGRVNPGKYPEPVSSRIYRGTQGAFILDEANSKVLEGVGLVSGAVWSDLDGDGFPELLLACEWGPLRIFHNDQGHLRPWDLPLEMSLAGPHYSLPPGVTSLSQLQGWWNGVTTGDLDGDGRLDIIASNWGENTKYQSHCNRKPLRLYYADFNDEGVFGLLETYFEPALGGYVPERRLDIVARSLPFLRGKFSTYQAYADAGIEAILGERLPQTRYAEANWLESTAFLNRGTRLAVRVMPTEAQLSPAFAVVVADFDGDGNEDVFLSQNFFAVEPETSRYDAGRGLWLTGDGQGGLRAVAGQESGLLIYGEQRGAAVADFDGDGRVDLVVSQNAAQTCLFKNVGGKPGLRVRLKGPPGNPSGIGAQMRVKHGQRLGPVREVHAGSGYWSQDSPVQVLGEAEPPAQLWVRWPGGKSFTVDIPAEATDIQVGIDGIVRPIRQRAP